MVIRVTRDFLIPAAKGIAFARHCARILGILASLNKLRCFIVSAFAVFMEDDPVAFRLAHLEINVAGDMNPIIFLIQVIGLLRICSNFTYCIVSRHPSVKLHRVLRRVITLANLVFIILAVIVGHNQDAVSAQSDIITVQISDDNNFINRRANVDHIAFCDFVCPLIIKISSPLTNILDSLQRIFLRGHIHRIIRDSGRSPCVGNIPDYPATEGFLFSKRTGTGIV